MDEANDVYAWASCGGTAVGVAVDQGLLGGDASVSTTGLVAPVAVERPSPDKDSGAPSAGEIRTVGVGSVGWDAQLATPKTTSVATQATAVRPPRPALVRALL